MGILLNLVIKRNPELWVDKFEVVFLEVEILNVSTDAVQYNCSSTQVLGNE